MVLILAACAALGAFPAATEGEQVVCEWDFARCMQGWIPNGTAHVKPDKDGIVIETDGRDPQLMSSKLNIQPRAGDVLEVRMAASRAGAIQWFWRTDTTGPFGGLSQEQSRPVSVEGSGNDRVVVARPFWKTDRPITGLRLDLPEGAPGVYRIGSF